eukprot:CAMPEP_0174272436 /NCGR_PEP_ID=MMETSP0439-20130205/51266_1 /TAXON_ID=0 /ORGANISM="Stereomyxa ramosa, Strain Chinc5" /LENGTH=289 /DNA_ID=CAMNT_0015362999 /DNA_START=17 /DNA_END=882 /DNA_ORIENTATION=-
MLSVCVIHFESQQGDKQSAQKLAKELLSTQRTNLALWNEYALMEYKFDNIEIGRRVYSTALSSTVSSSHTEEQRSLLFKCFAEQEFYSWAKERQHTSKHNKDTEENKEKDEKGVKEEPETETERSNTEDGKSNKDGLNVALFSLANMYSSNFKLPKLSAIHSIPPTTLLRARKVIKERLQNSISPQAERPSSLSKNICISFALFQYITLGLDQAMEVYQSFLSKYSPKSNNNSNLFEIWKAYVMLVITHSKLYTTSPAKIREVVTSALDVFPHEPFFLQLFVQGEIKSR